MIQRAAFLGMWFLGVIARPVLADYDYLFCSRTGSWVEAGDTSAQVLAKCGQPTRREEIRIAGRRGMTIIPCWIYDYGSGSFVRRLVFQGDRVARIETGNYGQ